MSSISAYDIVIVGGGIVGSALACALRQASLRIAVLERAPLPVWSPHDSERRVSAITPRSLHFFERLGVLKKVLASRCSPFCEMRVWDPTGRGNIHFAANQLGVPVLGYILENALMQHCLYEHIQHTTNLDWYSPVEPTELQESPDAITVITADQRQFRTQLLIAADGAQSWVRRHAGITTTSRSYGQTALVATVTTEKPHQKIAWQRFMPSGPLAFLPLQNEHHCSIVWSTEPDHADRLQQLTDQAFCHQLTGAFESRLGKIVASTPRLSFPLHRQHATHYIKPRLALVGDAAHTIHPLAGQGINLGLADVQCLADRLLSALDKQRDFASLATLRRYERERKSQNFKMLLAMDGFNALFSSTLLPVQLARNLGLNLADQASFMKQFFFAHSGGQVSM